MSLDEYLTDQREHAAHRIIQQMKDDYTLQPSSEKGWWLIKEHELRQVLAAALKVQP